MVGRSVLVISIKIAKALCGWRCDLVMLQKHQKPSYRRYIRRGATVFFIAEAVLFAASYGVWHRMNTSRDFRLYMHVNHNWALESYYKIGEALSSDSVRARELDLQVWQQEGKIPTKF